MKYLGLDLGTKTCGVAISDKTLLIASFYENITYSDTTSLVFRIKEIISKEGIEKIILGYPKNMNNTLGERVKQTLSFKEQLEKETQKEVILEDERMTTIIAEQALLEADLSRKKRKKVIDGLSAVVILQSFLDRKEK